jgi:hypothetical protein
VQESEAPAEESAEAAEATDEDGKADEAKS